MYRKARMLSTLAAVLLVGLPWVLGALEPGYDSARLISELGTFEMSNRSAANGGFFLIGVIWMGTVEATRKTLEPHTMPPWIRFGAIAFAASYIARVVFPCDMGCPVSGGGSQLVHNTLIWVLYAGAVPAGLRLRLSPAVKGSTALKAILVVAFLGLQVAVWQRQWLPGWWQRLYELSFALLWLLWVYRLTPQRATSQ